jgi:hypothetical protein
LLTPKSSVNRAAYDYWQSKRAGRAMPARADVDPAEMKSFLPHLVLFDVEHDPLDFRYRLIGTLVRENLHENHTGKRMSEIPHQKEPNTIWKNHVHVTKTGAPMLGQAPYVGPNKDFMSMEAVIMPLSDDDQTVTSLMVCVDYFRQIESD